MQGACKICGNRDNNKIHQVREMQLGLREIFPYMECTQCGCMQLLEIPDDLGKYYPNEGYYSFNPVLDFQKKPDLLRKLKASWIIYGKNRLLGRLLSVGYKVPDLYSWLKNTGVHYDDPILDVGAGNGSLLLNLFRIGFTRLTGIDPFIEKDLFYGPVNIYQKNIFEMTGKYDLIMLHHAFEHMDEPLKVLQQLYGLLNNGKYLLIRTPVMGMYSWKKYGPSWMDLDAPRHIIIHSLKSLELLAHQAGFVLKRTVFDGNYMSLIGSEQYSRDIALNASKSYMINKASGIFTHADIENLKETNKLLNRKGQADHAAFYLYKP